LTTVSERLRSLPHSQELRILGLNTALHIAVQILALQFMPPPYFSELSMGDANAYYDMAGQASAESEGDGIRSSSVRRSPLRITTHGLLGHQTATARAASERAAGSSCLIGA
jgi:hypothetical protein